MNNVLLVGPLAVPNSLLLLFAAAAATLYVGKRSRRRAGIDAEGRLVSSRIGELSAATLAERLRALPP